MESHAGHASLADVISLPSPSVVALIGAGGKTTIMLSLASRLTSGRRRTVVTTTTRIWLPDLPLVLSENGDVLPALRTTTPRSSPIALGHRVGPDGKLHGVSAGLICRLKQERAADVFLVEADGAAGRPLKVHGSHEPVIPPCAEAVLVLGGLDAVGMTLGEETIHRAYLLPRQTGQLDGATVDERLMVDCLRAAACNAPAGARVAFVLNKADGPDRVDLGLRVAGKLRSALDGCDVLLTSHGEIVARVPTSPSPV